MTDQLSGGVVQPTDAREMTRIAENLDKAIECGTFTSVCIYAQMATKALRALAVPQAPLQAEPVPVVASEQLYRRVPVYGGHGHITEKYEPIATPQAEPAVAEQARDDLIGEVYNYAMHGVMYSQEKLYGNAEVALREIISLIDKERALASQSTPPPESAGQGLSDAASEVARIASLREDRARRVYIAGPMTGLPGYNFATFNAKADELRAMGWHVENPADHGLVENAQRDDYLRWDLSRLATCGAIWLLEGWESSAGASMEVRVAETLGLAILAANPTAQPDGGSKA